jgi:hypothetical protein
VIADIDDSYSRHQSNIYPHSMPVNITHPSLPHALTISNSRQHTPLPPTYPCCTTIHKAIASHAARISRSDAPLQQLRRHVRGVSSLHLHNAQAPTRLSSAPLLSGRNMSLMNVLQPHPEDRLHLRLHRARSVILTAQEFVLLLLSTSLCPCVLHLAYAICRTQTRGKCAKSQTATS